MRSVGGSIDKMDISKNDSHGFMFGELACAPKAAACSMRSVQVVIICSSKSSIMAKQGAPTKAYSVSRTQLSLKRVMFRITDTPSQPPQVPGQ